MPENQAAIVAAPPIHRLSINRAFQSLTLQEKRYAHHLSRAAWHGTRIILRQVSLESIGIFDFILELYGSCSGNWKMLLEENGVTADECDAFLDYAATFLSNVGNYYGSGDQKFVPRLGLDSLEKIARRSPRLEELFAVISDRISSTPPYSLGYPSDQAQSAYYPGNARITQDEVAMISRLLEEKLIFPENTRIRKVTSTPTPTFEVLQASIEQDERIQEVFLPGSAGLVKIVRSDHSKELKCICAALSQASEHSANDTQKLFISQYIESFRTGSLDVYRNSQRTWITDMNPRVENIFGFVEPYRDPHGIRAEFEGLVAITDTEETKALLRIVEHSTQFIRLLPWANTESTANEGKGPFEKALFERPDFTSLHALAYCSSIIFPGINLPNYNDIRQECGFKNVIITNRMSTESNEADVCPFIDPSEAEAFQKHKYPTYYWWVVLHELLGHGTGKMMIQEGEDRFNFDINAPPINPLTGSPISIWYQPGQTWTGQFGDLATTVDECRAELVGAYLMDNEDLLELFGFHDKSEITAEDITYNLYLQLGVDGLRGLANFNIDNHKWGQAHSRAHFATLKCLLTDGGGFMTVECNPQHQQLIVRVDRSKMVSHGKPALGRMLLRLHMYRCTADVQPCRAYYGDLSKVDGEYLEWRKVVLANKMPRWVFVQANTFHDNGNVILKEYEASREGVIQSWDKRTGNPLWHRALERYREELEANDDYQSITEIESLEDLLTYTKTIEPLLPRERSALDSMNRLGPTLKFVDDFSAVIAVCSGADVKLTTFVWGSIRLMLTLASSAGDILKDVLNMLEELSLTLPRLKAYETTLPMDRGLETALVDVYTEVICFYARCIHFFRTHPHLFLRRDAWEDFRNDFNRTVRRIRRLSSTVEMEAESVRMRHERSKYNEVLDLMETLKETKLKSNETIHCHFIPSELSPRFWGREDALDAIEEALRQDNKPHMLKTLALYRMGGVGKTQIALQYANRNREHYEAIIWVVADNVISLGQSFREIAKLLGLARNDQEMQDAAAATLKVKNWLTEARCPWLLVFDNADDLEILRHVWPANGQGSIILTTRDASACHSPATAGFHVHPFDDATGSEVLLHLIGVDTQSPANQEKAQEITQTLGGLPLALNQISGFITQRRLPLHDFLPLYERNASKIDSRKTGIDGYEHTLSTVWEMSIHKLSGDPCTLLNLLAFFQPDAISETVLVEGSRLVDDAGLHFIQDEMDLGDAEATLLRSGLINKAAQHASLSIHRLTQAVVMRKQTNLERTRYFGAVVRILSWGFPNTWSEDVGHQFHFWKKCEECLPHVHHLVGQRNRYSIEPTDQQEYGELLLRCSWYLYERECYDTARNMVDAALDTFEDKTSLAFASAVDLSGLIDLDMNNPKEALNAFKKAFEIRRQLLGPGDPLIASSLNNIALAYTELGKLDKAYAIHEEAIHIRLSTKSDRLGNSYSNMSSLLLRMCEPDEAEEMLKRCPSLESFTDETFLNTGNPRFSGDMVLLSRIRLSQCRHNDAVRLASKALAFRQSLLGNRLKTCDSLYEVASLLYQQGNIASAIELLTQLTDIAESINEGKGQLARAYFKLAMLFKEREREDESRTCAEKAAQLRRELKPELADAAFEEKEFMKLCLWMLW